MNDISSSEVNIVPGCPIDTISAALHTQVGICDRCNSGNWWVSKRSASSNREASGNGKGTRKRRSRRAQDGASLAVYVGITFDASEPHALANSQQGYQSRSRTCNCNHLRRERNTSYRSLDASEGTRCVESRAAELSIASDESAVAIHSESIDYFLFVIPVLDEMTKAGTAWTTRINVDKSSSLRIVDKYRGSTLRDASFELATVPLNSAAVVLVESISNNDAGPAGAIDIGALKSRSTCVDLNVPSLDVQGGTENTESRARGLIGRKP